MGNKPLPVFRKAESGDIPFIIETIVAAEKSGSEIFSYSTIFEIPEAEVRNIFQSLLAEDVQGQELCFSDYLIAEVEGKIAGAVAGWIEAESGQASSTIKAMLLKYFFPEENMQKALEKRKYLEPMRFEPEAGSIVIESGLTMPEFRGQGILAKLMTEKARLLLERRPDITKSQIQFMKNNSIGFKIYKSLGYYVIEEKKCNDPAVLKLLPDDTRIIMEKKF